MSGFFSVLRFEIAKAVRARITWVVLVLPIVVTFATVAMASVSGRVRSIAEGMDSASKTEPSAYLTFARSANNGFVMAGILLLLYASMLVANEGHWRTFKTILIRPHHRVTWMLAKFSLLLLLGGLMIMLIGASAWVGGRVTGEYGAVMEDGYPLTQADELVRGSIRAFLLLIPAMMALAAFGLMFSTMTDHAGIANSLGLGGYILLEMFKSSAYDERIYFFNTFMPSLLDTTRDFGIGSYLKVLSAMADGRHDSYWPEHVIYFSVGTPLISASLFLTVAIVIFCRRDFLV